MFPVGALNPEPGNQAREHLLNALVQQLQQRRAAQQQNVVTPAAGFFDFMHKRQQQQAQQALSAATRPEGAGTQTALTALTNARAILPFLRGQLGAAAPRTDAGFASPGHDIPVPQAPGGFVPAHGPLPSTVLGGNTAGGGTMSPVPTPIPSAPHAGGGVVAPGSTIGSQAGMANAGISSAGLAAGAGFGTTPGGLVPVGPGVFINPATGQVFGTVPSGGGGSQFGYGHTLNVGA